MKKEYFPIYTYFPLSDIIKEKRQVSQNTGSKPAAQALS